MIYVQLLSDQMFVKAIGLDDHKPIKRQFKKTKQNKNKKHFLKMSKADLLMQNMKK